MKTSRRTRGGILDGIGDIFTGYMDDVYEGVASLIPGGGGGD